MSDASEQKQDKEVTFVYGPGEMDGEVSLPPRIVASATLSVADRPTEQVGVALLMTPEMVAGLDINDQERFDRNVQQALGLLELFPTMVSSLYSREVFVAAMLSLAINAQKRRSRAEQQSTSDH